MTIVTSRREVNPAQSRVLALSRRTNAGALSSPRLARGRDEKLVRSRSPTPPGHGQAIPQNEILSPRESTEQHHFNRADSPASSVAMRSASFSTEMTPTPSLSTASWASPGPSTQAWRRHARRQSQYSELSDVTEDYASDINADTTVVARHSRSQSHLSPEITSRHSDAPESEISHATSSTYLGANTESRFDPWADRRPPPIAPWPAGKPRQGDAPVDQDRINATAKKKGIKTPYATQDKKDKVKAVRLSGACMRCVIFRQACEVLSEGQTCKACDVVRRKWHIPCTRMWPRDRFVYLLPDDFFDHLQLSNNIAFPRYQPANRSLPFPLTIAKDYGLRIRLNVYAVVGVPLNHEMFRKITFKPGTAEISNRPSIPLMAEHTNEAVTGIEDKIREDMRRLTRNPETNGLVDIVFPDHDGDPWVREVFTMVCRYQEIVSQGQSNAIGLALKSIYVRVLIGRTFHVPPQEIANMNYHLPPDYKLPADVLEALQDGDYSMCPKFVDRYVKTVLFKLLKTKLLPECFAEVEELFHLMEKDHGKSKLSEWSRDEAFCAILVVLLFAGFCQIKIAQSMFSQFDYNWGNLNEHPDAHENLKRKATACIYNIEREVVDHILSLYTYQFGRERMTGQVRPQDDRAARVTATFNPIREFHNSKEVRWESIERIYPTLDLNRTDRDEFIRDNLSRLLKRLDDVLWRPKERRR